MVVRTTQRDVVSANKITYLYIFYIQNTHVNRKQMYDASLLILESFTSFQVHAAAVVSVDEQSQDPTSRNHRLEQTTLTDGASPPMREFPRLFVDNTC